MKALLVLLCVALPGIAAAQSVSPGPLAADHASLEGVDNCIKCHSGGGDAISPQSCLACHKTLAARITAKQGYHATLGSECASCHPDHRGVKAALIRWPGGAMEKLDHGKTGYPLTGGHTNVKCRDCHKPAFITLAVSADEKPKTFLGLSQTCSTCHEDIHKPTLGKDCQRCHTVDTWHVMAKTFDHAKTKFPLVGGHAKVECTKCHGGTDKKLADLHPKFDTCTACHKDPHATAMGNDRSCATCHTENTWKESKYDPRTHPKTIPLTGGHAIDCAKCHDPKLDKKPATTCVGCHPDPHKPSLGTRCEQCHDATAWTKAAMPAKVDFHDRTAYPLRGLHVSVKCAACHDPKKPAATRYRPIKHDKCLDCHADIHKGEADKPCESCHDVGGWKPARFEIADHAKTKYPLDGAHRAVPCTKCHDAPPKSPGFNHGNPACEACHADPHKGELEGPCASCHTVAAWSPSTFTKEAHAKAGFPLTGKHDVACGRCHAGTFKSVPTECSACHTDRHAGQFAPRKCTECHAGAEWKPAPRFDHARTFALRGRHATAQCSACHPKVRVQVSAKLAVDSEVYVLGKQLRECLGCHRAAHGEPGTALAQATRECTACHGEASWRDIKIAVLFDHSTTGAPLVGGHQSAACSGCHNPSRRKVPKLEACASCHEDRHHGKMGDRCESCHSPATWKQDQLLVDHQRTRLPLLGAHAVQSCYACHKDRASGDFRGLDPTCRGCHAHTVVDRRPHPDHTMDTAFLRCENCHSVLGWRPAHVDHDKLSFPLTGKHVSTPCVQCHAAGQPFSLAPKDCLSCHQKDEATANAQTIGHDTFGTKCQQCHNASSWTSVSFPHPEFNSSHHGSTCAQCHTTPNMPKLFSCISGGCHTQTATDSRHRNVGGYRYDSITCLKCHKG